MRSIFACRVHYLEPGVGAYEQLQVMAETNECRCAQGWMQVQTGGGVTEGPVRAPNDSIVIQALAACAISEMVGTLSTQLSTSIVSSCDLHMKHFHCGVLRTPIEPSGHRTSRIRRIICRSSSAQPLFSHLSSGGGIRTVSGSGQVIVEGSRLHDEQNVGGRP